jgi:vacuolar-type H+-ATPase subunit I/STV1
VAISQILKFPIVSIIEVSQKKRVNRWISVIITLVLLPSLYFGYNLVQKEKFVENANAFINNVSVLENNYLLKNEIKPIKNSIVLVYANANLSEIQKKTIRDKAKIFSLNNVKIEFPQGLSAEGISRKNTDSDILKSEINRINLVLQKQENHLDSLGQNKYRGQQILDEIKSLYPQIINCSLAESYVFSEIKS